jgi:multidrug efflux pump
MSVQQVADYAMRSIQPVLGTVEGVGEARMLGSGLFAMRIWLDPAKMAAFGVTSTDVSDAIRRDNYISAAGTTRGELVRASVDARTDVQDPEEFATIVVRQNGDQRVQLGDVAKVELASETYDSAVYSSGRETVFIAITEAPGANPLQMAANVKEKVAELNRQLPADITIFMDSDGSKYISEALEEVAQTLLEASLIVVLVVFLFLGSLRVVAIPIVAIPLSLITVLFLVWIMGFSINLLTLLAMVIAIGLVVDDAIVVVENVHRHIEEGAQPLEAAQLGARQVALPVIAMTLTLVAVYLPIGFLGGLTGVLFSEFALTLAGAVVVSGVVALVLSPMMCAYLLKDHEHQGAVASWLDARFDELHLRYEKLLAHCLDNRGAVMLFAAVIFASLPVFYRHTPRLRQSGVHDLFPRSDGRGLADGAGGGALLAGQPALVSVRRPGAEALVGARTDAGRGPSGGATEVQPDQWTGNLHLRRGRASRCILRTARAVRDLRERGLSGARPGRRRGPEQSEAIGCIRICEQRPALLASGDKGQH